MSKSTRTMKIAETNFSTVRRTDIKSHIFRKNRTYPFSHEYVRPERRVSSLYLNVASKRIYFCNNIGEQFQYRINSRGTRESGSTPSAGIIMRNEVPN